MKKAIVIGATSGIGKGISELLVKNLITVGIKYKKLSKQEISDLVRCNRVRKTIQ